jgi:hypothetical protein
MSTTTKTPDAPEERRIEQIHQLLPAPGMSAVFVWSDGSVAVEPLFALALIKQRYEVRDDAGEWIARSDGNSADDLIVGIFQAESGHLERCDNPHSGVPGTQDAWWLGRPVAYLAPSQSVDEPWVQSAITSRRRQWTHHKEQADAAKAAEK